MADEIDASDEKQQCILDAKLREISNKASDIPAGKPGECESCGEYNARLVIAFNPLEEEKQMCCSACRDKFLKAKNVRYL